MSRNQTFKLDEEENEIAKAGVVNDFMASSSPGSNCEVHESVKALNSLRNFLSMGDEPTKNEERTENAFEVDEAFVRNIPEKFKFRRAKSRRIHLHAHLAGWVGKRLLKSIGIYKTCQLELVYSGDTVDDMHTMINYRAYSPKALLRPNSHFQILFSKMNKIMH